LYRCAGATDFTPLGATIDDAAGEAFDKVASLLGLPYPGGPSIQKAAEAGNPQAIRFPRPLLDDRSRLDFSFSGLKTAVRYLVAGPGKIAADPSRLTSQEIADIAASFQEAVVDCLVGKAELALERSGFQTLCVGGGVAANKRFRERLEQSAAANGYELHIPPFSLCTDNAVMGAIAIERLKTGKVEDLSLDVRPGLERMPR
jgi:N6-L-threonylcarbamoyladenine synthase